MASEILNSSINYLNIGLGFVGEVFKSEFRYPILVFFLFVIPRWLARFKIPLAISAFLLGTLSHFVFGAFLEDGTVKLFASLGIIALFLFAGLEVDFNELGSRKKVIIEHLVVRIIFLVAVAAAIILGFPIGLQAGCIFALALLTPSTGFILEALNSPSIPQERQFWIKSKAISSELVALGVMFVAIKMGSLSGLVGSSIVLITMAFVLPVIFRYFAKTIVPHAPNSEFGLLLMLALIFGVITKKLGAYYLVGAFLVGVAGRRFEQYLPDFTSKKMLHSLRVFAGFFTPFYFFEAGLELSTEDLGPKAIALGLGLAAILLPVRIAAVMIQRQKSVEETRRESFLIATSLLPTLIFGLVLANILKDLFEVPSFIFGGLVIYTMLATIIPTIIFRVVAKGEKPPPWADPESQVF